MICLEFHCTNPEIIINKIRQKQISIYNFQMINELTYQIEIRDYDHACVSNILIKSGIEWSEQSNRLWLEMVGFLKERYIIMIGIVIILLATIYLPTRILFVEVRGNSKIPNQLLLERIEELGLSFGSSRIAINNEEIKSILLQKIPKLQWIGINTAGCVATVEVKEKEEKVDGNEPANKVSSLVAIRDGVVVDMTATKGTPMVKVGDAVVKDQTLISAYTDCGLHIQATEAKGEVWALTNRNYQFITPAQTTIRALESSCSTSYSVLIGKKLINFSKDSGIHDYGCVKIYTKKCVSLPGGFMLPLTIIKEQRYSCCSLKECPQDYYWLAKSAESYVTDNISYGHVMESDTTIQEIDQTIYMTGHYACVEMIGIRKHEETMKEYGISN